METQEWEGGENFLEWVDQLSIPHDEFLSKYRDAVLNQNVIKSTREILQEDFNRLQDEPL